MLTLICNKFCIFMLVMQFTNIGCFTSNTNKDNFDYTTETIKAFMPIQHTYQSSQRSRSISARGVLTHTLTKTSTPFTLSNSDSDYVWSADLHVLLGVTYEISVDFYDVIANESGDEEVYLFSIPENRNKRITHVFTNTTPLILTHNMIDTDVPLENYPEIMNRIEPDVITLQEWSQETGSITSEMSLCAFKDCTDEDEVLLPLDLQVEVQNGPCRFENNATSTEFTFSSFDDSFQFTLHSPQFAQCKFLFQFIDAIGNVVFISINEFQENELKHNNHYFDQFQFSSTINLAPEISLSRAINYDNDFPRLDFLVQYNDPENNIASVASFKCNNRALTFGGIYNLYSYDIFESIISDTINCSLIVSDDKGATNQFDFSTKFDQTFPLNQDTYEINFENFSSPSENIQLAVIYTDDLSSVYTGRVIESLDIISDSYQFENYMTIDSTTLRYFLNQANLNSGKITVEVQSMSDTCDWNKHVRHLKSNTVIDLLNYFKVNSETGEIIIIDSDYITISQSSKRIKIKLSDTSYVQLEEDTCE